MCLADHRSVTTEVLAADVDELGFAGEDLARGRTVGGIPRPLQVFEAGRCDCCGIEGVDGCECVDAHDATLERIMRTPVVNRKVSQTRNPAPATPNNGMASPIAIAGPATAPTTSIAAPTGARRRKTFGVMPAAMPARDRPTNAAAIDRSSSEKTLLCSIHSDSMAPPAFGWPRVATPDRACSAATT